MPRISLKMVVVLVAINSASVQAQDVFTNVAAEMNNRLAAAPAVTYSRKKTERRKVCVKQWEYLGPDLGEQLVERCSRQPVEITEHYKAAAELASYEIESVSDVRLQEMEVTSLPSILFQQTARAINCGTTTDLTPSTGFGVSGTTSSSARVTRGVSHTRAVNAQLRFQLNKVFTGTVGGSLSQTVNFTESETEGESETKRYDYSDRLATPPSKKRVVVARLTQQSVSIPFDASVRINGNLKQNTERNRLSDILSSGQREIRIEGALVLVDHATPVFVNFDAAVTPDECEALREEFGVEGFFYPVEENSKEFDTFVELDAPSTLIQLQNFGRPYEEGDLCLYGPCSSNGYREVCYIDGSLACADCRDEPDSICEEDDDWFGGMSVPPPLGNTSLPTE